MTLLILETTLICDICDFRRFPQFVSAKQLHCILSLFIMDDMAWELIYAEELQDYVDQNGVSDIEEFFKNKLERWRDIEVNIGITGDSGTGKSSFINSIRG